MFSCKMNRKINQELVPADTLRVSAGIMALTAFRGLFLRRAARAAEPGRFTAFALDFHRLRLLQSSTRR